MWSVSSHGFWGAWSASSPEVRGRGQLVTLGSRGASSHGVRGQGDLVALWSGAVNGLAEMFSSDIITHLVILKIIHHFKKSKAICSRMLLLIFSLSFDLLRDEISHKSPSCPHLPVLLETLTASGGLERSCRHRWMVDGASHAFWFFKLHTPGPFLRAPPAGGV